MILVLVLVLTVICIVTAEARIIRHIDLAAGELHIRIANMEKRNGKG